MPAQDIATRHYLRPGVMTAAGPGQPLLAGLPGAWPAWPGSPTAC